MKKILIIRFSSIGDIVLTTPIIRCVKEQVANSEVHFLTKASYASILKENPHIDKVHLLEKDESIGSLAKRLKQEKFDFIVDLHQNLRTRILKFHLATKSASYHKLNIEKWLLTKFKINKLPNVHIVDRYFNTVKGLNVTNDNKGLEYHISESDQVDMEWLPQPFRSNYAALSIGGQHATKRLPVDRLIELCHRINGPVILLGGKEDQAIGEEIEAFFAADEGTEDRREKFNTKTQVFNGCGKFNINQSASIIKQSKIVFTHDTGLMHIAAAFEKHIYSIWGNTIPEFGMYPYQTRFKILEVKDLDCRPCSKIGFDSCPKGHFNCMQKIEFNFYEPLSGDQS